MIRPARLRDIAALDALLEARADSSMFLAVNHARGTPGMWVVGDPVAGVVQLAPSGYFLTQAEQVAPQDWAKLRRRLSARPCHGVNGPPEQVAAALDGLGLGRRAATLDRVEPLFGLDLADLAMPPGDTTLRPLAQADIGPLTPWRMAYLVEAMGNAPGPDTAASAAAQLGAMLTAGHARVLERDGQPVAMCNFNAALPHRVQVGAVFTPPELRGRGHGRRAVALMLQEARARGVLRAVLFAANEAAARAYQGIGFRRIGDYRLVLYTPAVLIGG
ncbi:GNAT family N-acetyltransferase [Acidimangrovimonas pyrenivorans]|uniref:GNAT family N-acetyltransferase n=1 Tax=Acidimangrovimonas pyrenivorans TaxID=2030798 RepID=A0ABV7AMU3_9RHOB